MERVCHDVSSSNKNIRVLLIDTLNLHKRTYLGIVCDIARLFYYVLKWVVKGIVMLRSGLHYGEQTASPFDGTEYLKCLQRSHRKCKINVFYKKDSLLRLQSNWFRLFFLIKSHVSISYCTKCHQVSTMIPHQVRVSNGMQHPMPECLICC